MVERITRDNIAFHLIEYELSLVEKTPMEIVDNDKWRFTNTLTRIQQEEFKKYAIKLIQKTFKCNKTKAVNNFDWFYHQFGLRLKG